MKSAKTWNDLQSGGYFSWIMSGSKCSFSAGVTGVWTRSSQHSLGTCVWKSLILGRVFKGGFALLEPKYKGS